jgi:hypothetical protein
MTCMLCLCSSRGPSDDKVAAAVAARAKQLGIAEAGKTPEVGLVSTVGRQASGPCIELANEQCHGARISTGACLVLPGLIRVGSSGHPLQSQPKSAVDQHVILTFPTCFDKSAINDVICRWTTTGQQMPSIMWWHGRRVGKRSTELPAKS